MNTEILKDIDALVTYILDSEENNFLECIDNVMTYESDTYTLDDLIEMNIDNPNLNHIYQNAYRVRQALTKLKIIETFEFNELSDSAKQKVITSFYDDVNMDYYIDDCIKPLLTELGFETFDLEYSLDYSHSQYVTLTGSFSKPKNVKELLLAYPNCEHFINLIETLPETFDLDDVEYNSNVCEFVESVKKYLLELLLNEYNYQFTDECIIDIIDANEYRFTVDGEII